MKRIKAFFLLLVMLVGFATMLSGCAEVTADSALSMGQWLTLLADSFGMEYYRQEQPYFEMVPTDDEYFGVFQMAAEWDVIEPSNTVSSDLPVTWGDVLISLVNAGGFLEEDASHDEKISYAIEHFDSTIRRYWENRYIKMKQAVQLLDVAQNLWATRVYTEAVEEIGFSSGVVNFLEEDALDYVIENNTVVLSEDFAANLEPGTVYTLPGNESVNAGIYKVESIEIKDGQAYIVNDDNFSEDEAWESIEELVIQETDTFDFSKISGIYDEDGNAIVFEEEEEVDTVSYNDGSTITLSNLVATNYDVDAEVVQTGIFDGVKGATKFKLKNGYSINLSFSTDSFTIGVNKTLDKASSRYREMKQEAYVQCTFSDVELTKDIDYSWGKLHSALIKLSYDTTIQGGIKIEKSEDIGSPLQEGEFGKQHLTTVLKEYATAIENLEKDVYNTEIEDEIYICRISFLNGGWISADLVLKGKVTASGELKIVIEVEGAQGIEYKNGSIRYVKSNDVDTNFVAEGKLEITLTPGIEITLLTKINLIGFDLNLGIGAEIKMTYHLVDTEWHLISSGEASMSIDDVQALEKTSRTTMAEDILELAQASGATWDAYEADSSVELKGQICIDWAVYPVAKLSISGSSIVGKLMKNLGVSVSKEFLGKKCNWAKSGHIDGASMLASLLEADSLGDGILALLGVGASCAYDFKPWDSIADEMEELEDATENTDIEFGDSITLSTMRIFLHYGECQQIEVTGIPNGYSLSDIVAEIEDPDIATFDLATGTVASGDKEGTTQIVVQTKDGKYKVYCAVTVSSNGDGVGFTPIENAGGGGSMGGK